VSPVAAAVRWASLIASAFVVLGFVFFLVNQTSTASKNQVVAITGGTDVKAESATKVPNPSPAVEKLHEFVDDVNDVLLAPFTGIINSDSIWVIRLFTLGCALLIYGLLGQYLARAMGLRRW
jgi:hypothetical protein